MSTLFDPEQSLAMVHRLRALRPDMAPQWGKMTPAQACAHCQVALKIALGDLQWKRTLVGRIFGGLGKRMVLAPKDFGRNMPTDPRFIVKDNRDLDVERDALVALLQRFTAAGPGGMRRDPHPFFGVLTPAEWDTLQWKHLDHHLRQFGA
ncbi:MAG: DUF1569 domain-containing protein [Planctomycetota bacterium]